MNTSAMQWREAALELRRHADEFDARAAEIEGHAICGVVSQSGPNLEPLACGYPSGHAGSHAWSALPTFTPSEPQRATEQQQ